MKKLARKVSKRISTRQRVKTEKKIREHARKVRKEKRKNPGKFSKSKKDPGVPNMCPFKEKVLQEVEESRQRKAEEKAKRRERLQQLRKEARTKTVEEKRANGIDVFDKDAFKKLQQLETTLRIERELKQRMTERSAKAFFKEFGKMVENADVVIQVLDARDPMGTRCKEVEVAVLAASKRLVLVLNKADLVPRETLEQWVTYLRAELPTVAVKSSTQSSRIAHGKVKVDTEANQTTKWVGASTLMSILTSYCHKESKDIEKSIKVGVVGLPNVGRKSLINSLKKARGIETTTEGDAKSEVQLDPKIALFESPATILASGLMTDPAVALRNIVKVDSLDDPVTPVKAILERIPKESMMLQYKISDFKDVDEFLRFVSLGMKKLKKGGTPSPAMAAKMVLNDWNMGRIKFFTNVPETRSSHISEEAIAQHTNEFSLDKLEKLEKNDWEKLPIVLPVETVLIPSAEMVAEASKEDPVEDAKENDEEEEESDEDDDEAMDEDEQEVLEQMIKAMKSRPAKKEKGNLPLFKEEGLSRQKKLGKLRDKKEKGNKKNAGESKKGKMNNGVANGKKNIVEPKEKKNGVSKSPKVASTGDNYDFNDF